MRTLWFSLILSLAVSAQPSCRCLYGERCWPKPSEFAELNLRLSQPLLHPRPPASACYPAQHPSGNCTDVILNASNGRWRSEQPGSMQAPNFEAYISKNGTISACYLNTTLGFPCDQGSVPPVGVTARSVSDVQVAVKFAVQHNLRLVVKNTGHDFLGRSTARGAFLLWMHNLKNMTFHDTFIPAGAPSGKKYKKAITLGAGVQWHEAYTAAERHNRFILGGISNGGSVGAVGGWLQGGGHSAFSPSFGLGVDNVIQFTVVTSSGRLLTVNSYQNSDLFWALRGGGGGTYAVIISATYMTHDLFPLSSVSFSANFSSPQTAKSVITEYVKIGSRLADEGWGGYAFISAQTLAFLYVTPNVSVTVANSTLESFITLSQHATGGQARASYISFDSFSAWDAVSQQIFQATFHTGDGSVGFNVEMVSRFLSRELADNNPEKMTDVMLAVNGGVAINVVGGGVVSKVDPDSKGLHPDWRTAISHVFTSEQWPEGAPVSVIKQARQRLREKLDILNGLSTGSATYFNEASLYERDFKRTFFGSHYNRLKSIKAKYDPHDLFVVPSGVGSEEWDAELICRRRTIP